MYNINISAYFFSYQMKHVIISDFLFQISLFPLSEVETKPERRKIKFLPFNDEL